VAISAIKSQHIIVPQDHTVFTEDIVFVNGHPVIWAGPVGNEIRACDLILGWDVETVVPGHGPITGKAGVRAMNMSGTRTRKRHDAGLGYEEAARDISLTPFADWTGPECIVVNGHSLHREFARDRSPPDTMALFAAMWCYHNDRNAQPAR
jgi:cyclase